MAGHVKTLAELAVITPGFSPRPSERRKKGVYLLLGGRNIREGRLITTAADSYVETIDRKSFRRAVAKPGDIIISTLFDKRKLLLYGKKETPAVVNSSCAIIRAGAGTDYIVSYLRTLAGQEDFLEKATKATHGRFIPRLSITDLANIQVPILPVKELARLGDASIKRASDDELLAIKRQLESKNLEINQLRAAKEEVVRFYEDRLRVVTEQLSTNTLADRISNGETKRLEFKQTLRWNIRARRFDREIENAVLKTIVAFCNSDGGELVIGVADDKTIVGVEQDRFPNGDKFQLHFRNILIDRIVPTVVHLVEYDMIEIKGKTVCHVVCKESNREIWLKPDKKSNEQFYIRIGPSSTELPPRDAVKYIVERLHSRG